MSTLKALHQEVADILDQASVRGKVPHESVARLREMPKAWREAHGSDAGLALIAQAQGVAGMLNSSGDDDPLSSSSFEQLLQLKKSWRELLEHLA